MMNSGPENVVYDIVANLDRTKYNPIIVTMRMETEGKSIANKFKDLDVENRMVPFSTMQMQFRTSWVAKQIENQLSDVDDYVVHAHTHFPVLIASKMMHKTVATIHNISGEDYVMKYGKILGNAMAFSFNHNLRNIDIPVAISDYMSIYYQKYSNSNLTTIYNGVDVKTASENKATLRKMLKLREDSYNIVVIGSVSPRKNTLYLIDQLKKSEDKDFNCLIVGSGVDLEVCKHSAGDDVRFRFEGFQNDVSNYLNMADLCISASLSEGLPLSVLEAINVGVPMLMSDIPPHKEIEAAMQMDAVKTFSLASDELLSAFEKMKYQNFDTHALQKKAHELFSAKTMAEKYENVYESLKNNI